MPQDQGTESKKGCNNDDPDFHRLRQGRGSGPKRNDPCDRGHRSGRSGNSPKGCTKAKSGRKKKSNCHNQDTD